MVKMQTDNRKVSDKHSFILLLIGYYGVINSIGITALFALSNVGILLMVNIVGTTILALLTGLALFFQGESEKFERGELDRLAKKYLVKEQPKAEPAPKTETLGDLVTRLKGDDTPTSTPAQAKNPDGTTVTHTNPNLPSSVKFDSNSNLA